MRSGRVYRHGRDKAISLFSVDRGQFKSVLVNDIKCGQEQIIRKNTFGNPDMGLCRKTKLEKYIKIKFSK